MKRQKLYVPGKAVGEDERVYLHKRASGTITVIGIGIKVIVLTEWTYHCCSLFETYCSILHHFNL